jgi:hypothetical protein
MTRETDPTPEDYEKARQDVEHAHERMLEILARREARSRVDRERQERRRARLRRFSLGLLGR